ncbi:MAG: hypothetical protein HY331_15895, partial [Chloroflexi bacterium]|nr:hypothetical protein [Chloroflexota bacterium]
HGRGETGGDGGWALTPGPTPALREMGDGGEGGPLLRAAEARAAYVVGGASGDVRDDADSSTELVRPESGRPGAEAPTTSCGDPSALGVGGEPGAEAPTTSRGDPGSVRRIAEIGTGSAAMPVVTGVFGASREFLQSGVHYRDPSALDAGGEPGAESPTTNQGGDSGFVVGASAPGPRSGRAARPRSGTGSDTETGREADSFSLLPDLVIVDGGKGQVGAALAAMRGVGADFVPLAGLAKENEEIFLPGQADPIVLPRTSPALYLVQRIRDEAHRFAVAYHTKVRGKRSMRSALDEVAGVGPRRKAALLRHFGTVKAIREASVDELAAVPGMTRSLAARIKSQL